MIIWVDINLKDRWCPSFGKEESVEVKEFSEEEIKTAMEPGKIQKFFSNQINDFVKKWRYAIITIAALYIGFGIYMATQLKPLSKEENFLPEDHYVTLLRTQQSKTTI